MEEYPKIPCAVNAPLLELIIMKATAVISNNTPRVRKIKTPGVTILNLCTAILPIPYESSERVITKAPTIDNGCINISFF
jgi:hypothetical protein